MKEENVKNLVGDKSVFFCFKETTSSSKHTYRQADICMYVCLFNES